MIIIMMNIPLRVAWGLLGSPLVAWARHTQAKATELYKQTNFVRPEETANFLVTWSRGQSIGRDLSVFLIF